MRTPPVVKILRYSDPERIHLAKSAAIFLGKTDEENVKRPVRMLYHQPPHKSIYRGEHVRFEFVTSKTVYDHLTTYTTANVRACAGLRANRAGDFVLPLEVEGTELEDVIQEIGEAHLSNYNHLADGIDPDTQDPIKKVRLQAARAVAPMAVNLHYILEFNFLTLMESIFVQRTWGTGAQADTKEVVDIMWELTRAYDPELWDAAYEVFGPEALAWQKVRFSLKKKGMVDEVYRLLKEHGKMSSMWDKK